MVIILSCALMTHKTKFQFVEEIASDFVLLSYGLRVRWDRRGGLMGNALDSGSRSLGSGSVTWPGHCVVFLGKTLYSPSTSLHTQE